MTPEQPHTVKEEQTTSVDIEQAIKELACDFMWENNKPPSSQGYQYVRKMYDKWLSESYYHKNKISKWNQGKEAGETVKGDDLEDKLCRMYDLWVVEKRQSFRSAVKEFIKNEYANQFRK